MSANELHLTRYLRLVSFFIDVGTEVVYKIFLYFIPGPDKNVEAFLSSEHAKDTLRKLNHDKKVLSDKQFCFVTRRFPNAEKFDISLLITLLSNLFNGHLAPPANGWKTSTPGENDVSVAADLLRLRKLRNNIVGHLPRARISEGNFDRYWKQLEDIFTRTCKVIDPANELEIAVKIEQYKTRNLDAENVRLIRKQLEELTEICEDVIKLQEQVEQLMEKQNEFFQFFRKRPERFIRYTELLYEGGRFVLAELLQKELIKQGKKLSTLLEEKIEGLTKELGEEALIAQLKDEPEEWDVFVLAVVLLALFNGEMNRIDKKSVVEILEALKDYANNALLSLDPDTFSSPCENLVHCLKTLSYSLGEDAEAKIEECIKKYKIQTPEYSNDTDDSFLEKLKTHGINTKTLSSVYEETLKQLKEAMKVMEESGINFKNDHVFQLKMITLGGDSEKKKLAEDILSTVWTAALDGSDDPGEFKQVRQEIDKILEEIRKRGGQTGNLERSCIFITIRCASSDDVINVLEYFESTLFQEQFYNLSNELSTVCSHVLVVSASLTLESLNTALMNPTGREDENATEELSLPVICGSAEDIHKVLRLFTADTTTNSFNKISEELSNLLQDKISVKLYSDLQQFSGVFEDTDTSTSDSPTEESEMDETGYYTASFQNEYQTLFDEMEGMTLEEMGHWINIEEPCTSSVGLKQALINYYKKNYTSLSISPYLENMTLDELYVPPYPLQAIESLQPQSVYSLREILIIGDTVFKDVYVTAPTGYGKTAYIQWLTQCWCQAHEIKPVVSSRFDQVSCEIRDDDVEMMKDFEYLFTISLCKLEVPSLNVTHIIKEHIKRNIGTRADLLTEIDFALLGKKCLVLFDGLDEVLSYGKSDDIIDRDVGDNSTIVTTTTPWAFEQMAKDYSGRTYRQITLGQMSKELNQQISEKIIMFFKERTIQIREDPFSRVLPGSQEIKILLDVARSLELQKCLETPILLSHIVGIYVAGKLTDSNKPELYSSLVNLLTIRAEEKLAVRMSLAKFKRDSPRKQIIPNLTVYVEYIDLYEKIGELAFNMLFGESNPLFLFDETEVDRYITSLEGSDSSITASYVLEAGLKLGLLVKQSNETILDEGISFADVTFQSYFAAIYIAYHDKKEQVCDTIYQRFRSSAEVCLLSDVCIFLCAFYPEGGLDLLQKCQIVVSNDDTVKAYRESIEDKNAVQIKQIQDMLVIWRKEIQTDGVMNVCLNDCIVDYSCQSKCYRSTLKKTIQGSKTSMLSLRIDNLPTVESDDEMSPFLKDLLENGFENLQKLRIADSDYFRKMDFVKFSSLKIVRLENIGKTDKERLYQMFKECNLEGFGLVKATMYHDDFNTILGCVANKKTIKQLVFDTIICVEHGDVCRGFVIELNEQSNLQTLTLVDIPVSDIKVNLCSLDDLRVGSLSEKIEHDILVPDNKKMKISSFTCLDWSLGSAIGPFLERLPFLTNLDVEFIDLQCLKQIRLPSLMKYLNTIRFVCVALEADTVKTLVDRLKNVKRCVIFDMVDCEVKPLENFEKIIVDVQHSPRFTECVADKNTGSLVFKTKGGK